jgi:hypothetical protein
MICNEGGEDINVKYSKLHNGRCLKCKDTVHSCKTVNIIVLLLHFVLSHAWKFSYLKLSVTRLGNLILNCTLRFFL